MSSLILMACASAAALSLVGACTGGDSPTKLNFDAEWQQALQSLPPEILRDPQLSAVPPPSFRSFVLGETDDAEESLTEIVEETSLIESQSGLVVTDLKRSDNYVEKGAGPGGRDFTSHYNKAATTLSAYGGLVDLVHFSTSDADGESMDDSLYYIMRIRHLSGRLFPLRIGNVMRIEADVVRKSDDVTIIPMLVTHRIELSIPAKEIHPQLTGKAWVISQDDSKVYYLEHLGFSVTGPRDLKLLGFDDGRRRAGPSYASIARGHAEAGEASRRQEAAAMASALQQLGQASAGLAATLADPSRVVPTPSLPTSPGVSTGRLPQLAAETSGTGAGSSPGATPTLGGFSLNEQIFQQRCVQATPGDEGEVRACQALAQSLGRSYTSAANPAWPNTNAGHPTGSSPSSTMMESIGEAGNPALPGAGPGGIGASGGGGMAGTGVPGAEAPANLLGPSLVEGRCEQREREILAWGEQNAATARGICDSAQIALQLYQMLAEFYPQCQIQDPTGERARQAREAIPQTQATIAASCDSNPVRLPPPGSYVPPPSSRPIPIQSAPSRPNNSCVNCISR